MSSKKTEPEKISKKEEKLLNTLLEKGIREIKPKRIEDSIIYNGLEDLSKEIGYKEVQEQLSILNNKEYLLEHSYDSAILCPKCDSIHVYTRYTCPQCQSINIKKIQMIEHTYCGNIGNINEFENGKELICPKCKTKLTVTETTQLKTEVDKKKEIKIIGSSFTCEKCGSKFERPAMSHICEKCGNIFTFREAIHMKLPSYELTEKVQEIAAPKFENEAISRVETIFKQNGFAIERDAKINGKSGAQQSFDLVAKKDQKIIILDVSTWGNQTDLISLLGKKMDIDAQLIFLLDLEGNPTLPSLGKAYNINVLNGKDPSYLDTIIKIIGEPVKEDEKRSPFWRRVREEKE